MSNEAPADADTVEVDAPASWRDELPADIQDNPTLAKYESIDKLASAHINLQSHLGRDKIAKPVTDDDWNDVYDFLGRPESAEAYGLDLPEDLPDAVKADIGDEVMGAYRAQAHQLGLTDQQAQGLFGWYLEATKAGHEQLAEQKQTSIDEGEAALRAEWGNAYDQKVGFAKKAFSEYGGDDLVQLMEQTGLGNHPAILKSYAKMAEAAMPDKDLVGAADGRAALTPEEHRAEANSLMAHPAYFDKKHPEHRSVVTKVTRALEMANGQ